MAEAGLPVRAFGRRKAGYRVQARRDRRRVLRSAAAVKGHIQLREVKLAGAKDGGVEVSCGDHSLEKVPGQRRAGFHMAGKAGQDFRIPDPVLEHLRRRFNEVALGAGAGTTKVPSAGEGLVEDVAELVEKGLDLRMSEERRLRGRRFGEVRDDGAYRLLVA